MASSIESLSPITESNIINGPDSSTASNRLQLVPEGRSPTVRGKGSEDGFHWRKYGQKVVKGNEFVRSYYRCTYPNCQVKKQLECSQGGKIADTVYFGHHDHPKPLHYVPFPVLDDAQSFKPSDHEGNYHSVSSPHAPSISSAKNAVAVKPAEEIIECRRKKPSEDKATGETRLVVQTLSEVDVVNDGHRWRKYGQKMVKGNPNPRSYYRCSFPGCPVKKQVERASHDPKLVLTSYEGEHEHDVPPSRTASINNGGPSPSIDDSPAIKRKGEQMDTDHVSKVPVVM